MKPTNERVPTKPRTSALAIKGLEAQVEIRRHPAARRLTLRVSQTRRAVIVTVPARCRMDEAGSFVHRNLDWVRERLGNLPVPAPLADGMALPIRGDRHVVRFSPVARGPVVHVETAPCGTREIRVKGLPEHCPRRLRDWLYAEAKRDLNQQVLFHAGRLNVKVKRISLRDQSSRWGSCSSTGVLSFSWRLILAPPLVLDYVAAHEVAHLAEMNHGPRFWALVRQTMPDMDVAKAWLGKNGLELHRYDVSMT
jgi:predicted metal-dependent hydrolase